MAEASKTIDVDLPIERLWSVITDYEKYAEFVEGVDRVKVLERNGSHVKVEYAIQLLGKDIIYRLDHVETSPAQMRWNLIDSNIMKANQGGWELKDLGNGRTQVTYSLALDFKIYVPGMILNGLVKSSLPKMLDSFASRARKV